MAYLLAALLLASGGVLLWMVLDIHPIVRYKRKIRGLGIKRNGKPHKRRHKAERGVYHRTYIRFYPNFGFTVGSFHWCRAKKSRGH